MKGVARVLSKKSANQSFTEAENSKPWQRNFTLRDVVQQTLRYENDEVGFKNMRNTHLSQSITT